MCRIALCIVALLSIGSTPAKCDEPAGTVAKAEAFIFVGEIPPALAVLDSIGAYWVCALLIVPLALQSAILPLIKRRYHDAMNAPTSPAQARRQAFVIIVTSMTILLALLLGLLLLPIARFWIVTLFLSIGSLWPTLIVLLRIYEWKKDPSSQANICRTNDVVDPLDRS